MSPWEGRGELWVLHCGYYWNRFWAASFFDLECWCDGVQIIVLVSLLNDRNDYEGWDGKETLKRSFSFKGRERKEGYQSSIEYLLQDEVWINLLVMHTAKESEPYEHAVWRSMLTGCVEPKMYCWLHILRRRTRWSWAKSTFVHSKRQGWKGYVDVLDYLDLRKLKIRNRDGEQKNADILKVHGPLYLAQTFGKGKDVRRGYWKGWSCSRLRWNCIFHMSYLDLTEENENAGERRRWVICVNAILWFFANWLLLLV